MSVVMPCQDAQRIDFTSLVGGIEYGYTNDFIVLVSCNENLDAAFRLNGRGFSDDSLGVSFPFTPSTFEVFNNVSVAVVIKANDHGQIPVVVHLKSLFSELGEAKHSALQA